MYRTVSHTVASSGCVSWVSFAFDVDLIFLQETKHTPPPVIVIEKSGAILEDWSSTMTMIIVLPYCMHIRLTPYRTVITVACRKTIIAHAMFPTNTEMSCNRRHVSPSDLLLTMRISKRHPTSPAAAAAMVSVYG